MISTAFFIRFVEALVTESLHFFEKSSSVLVGRHEPEGPEAIAYLPEVSGGLTKIFSTPSVPFGAADFSASGSCRPPRGLVELWIAGFWFEAKGLRILFGTDRNLEKGV